MKKRLDRSELKKFLFEENPEIKSPPTVEVNKLIPTALAPVKKYAKAEEFLIKQREKFSHTKLFDENGNLNTVDFAILMSEIQLGCENPNELEERLINYIDTLGEDQDSLAEALWRVLLENAEIEKQRDNTVLYTLELGAVIPKERVGERLMYLSNLINTYPEVMDLIGYETACIFSQIGKIEEAKELVVRHFSLIPGSEFNGELDFAITSIDEALDDDDLVAIRDFLQQINEPEMQVFIGHKYEVGDGVDLSCEKAAIWYRRAVEKKFPHAMNNLSILLMEEKIAPKKGEHWKELLKKSAEMGVSTAQLTMGIYLYLGDKTFEKDEQAGLAWIKKSADQGLERAIEMLKEINESRGGFFSKLFARS